MHLAVDKHHIGFGNIVVGNNGGKGEKQQRNGQHTATKAGHHCIKGCLHIGWTHIDTGQTLIEVSAVGTLNIVETGQQNHKRRR